MVITALHNARLIDNEGGSTVVGFMHPGEGHLVVATDCRRSVDDAFPFWLLVMTREGGFGYVPEAHVQKVCDDK